MLNIINTFASCATLILFVFYFVGRWWVIKQKSVERCETFDVDYDSDGTLVECPNEYDLGGLERVKITSSVPVRCVKAYSLQYDEDGGITGRKLMATHSSLLMADEPVYFKVDVPEGYPLYEVHFEREDYIKGSFKIAYNGRYGGVYPMDYALGHTVKSFLYYMLK